MMDRIRLVVIVVGLSVLVVAIVVAIAVPVALHKDRRASNLELAKQYMREVPFIDGHNDWPWQLKVRENNLLQNINLNSDLRERWDISHTDIPRLRAGLVGGQFWSAATVCSSQYKDALWHVLDQIDVIKRMVQMYPETFDFVTTAQGIVDAHENGKIASLIGVEGGHHIDSSMAALRILYEVGVRYMTVTHNCNTPWADSWPESESRNPEHNGLTDWGKDVIREMNRLGMLIDPSHTSVRTMSDILDISQAPVMFSHTASYSLCNYYRNVKDEILTRLANNGGVLMVGFYTPYINCPPGNVSEDRSYATLQQVAGNMDYIKEVCGWECVGVGSDYDGADTVPEGLEDVSTFPALIEELINRGWTEEEVKGAIGNNLLRVFREVEKVSATLRTTLPYEDTMPRDSGAEINNTCRTYIYNPPT